MNPLLLLFSTLANLLAGRGKNELAEGLLLVSDLVRAGKEGSEEFETLTNELQAMVDADRDPTPAEFEAIRDRRAQLSDQLQSLPAANQNETGPATATGVSAGTGAQLAAGGPTPNTEPDPNATVDGGGPDGGPAGDQPT